MDRQKPLQPYHRRVISILLAVTVAMLLVVQVFPLDLIHRLLLIGLTLLIAAGGWVSIEWISARGSPSPLIIYGAISIYNLGIATSEFLLGGFDLSGLYFIWIVTAAVLWDYKAAFFSAFLASILQPLVATLSGVNLANSFPGFLWRGSLYFAIAYLISEFALALNTRWRVAMAVGEQQNQEISKRKDELEVLYEIAQSFGNLQDNAAIMRQLTARVAQVLKGERCMIAEMNSFTGEVQGKPPGFGLSDAEISGFHYAIHEEMLATWDLRKEPHFISQDPNHLPRELGEFAARFQIKQIVAARMIVQGEPIGYVVVSDKTDGSYFTDSDARLLSTLAEQIGMVVENARLYRDLETNLENAARLYAISTELLARLDPDEIPHRVVATVAEALHAPIATIALLNENTGLLEYKAQIGMPEAALQIPFRKNGLGMSVVESDLPRFIEDQAQVENSSIATQMIGARSLACLPIRRKDKRIGALYVNYTEPHRFTATEKSLLAIFANQTAIALDNSQLYAREQQRATELDLIAKIGQHVTSILDLDDLLPTLVHLVRHTFHYRYIHFFINDHVNHLTVLRAVEGPDPAQIAPQDFAMSFGQGIIGWVAEHGETLVANDVSQEPRYVSRAALLDTKSELAVPVKVASGIIGVLDVQSDQPNAFEKSRVALFETLVGQVAVAIENARLYSELQDQARRDSLTQVFNHGHFIECLNSRVAIARQDAKPISLIMLDIDYYKEYNDRYGHIIGDQVLTEIVQAIRANIKSTDVVGRWGGEEFGILLPGADSERACLVADRIRETLRETQLATQDGSAIIPPTVSQGIACIPQHTQIAATLISLADAALYLAKNRGRDQIQITQPQNK